MTRPSDDASGAFVFDERHAAHPNSINNMSSEGNEARRNFRMAMVVIRDGQTEIVIAAALVPLSLSFQRTGLPPVTRSARLPF